MKQLQGQDFRGQNWLLTPAALAVSEPKPATVYDQQWLVVLSGVVEADLKGGSPNQWLHETLSFQPELAGLFDRARDRYGVSTPPESGGAFFSVEQWCPFVSLSSIYDQDASDNAGFAVDVWRPMPFLHVGDVLTGQVVDNIFNGIEVDVAVRDSDAWIFRIAYNITLLGKIVFASGFGDSG